MYFGSKFERGLVAIGMGFVISTACLGQASAVRNEDQKRAGKNTRALTEIERRGLENLDRIALEARQIDNSSIRAELQSLIADALWDFDKLHARNIFLDAFKNARALTDKRQAAVAQTQVIKRIWVRDHAWAEELMKQLAVTNPETKNDPQGDFGLSSQFGMKSASPVNQQKLELARELLEIDSSAAGDLIGASLKNDVSFAGVNLLAQLRSKDPAAADGIFQRAVQQLSTMTQPSGIMAAIAMGDYLAPSCGFCSPVADAPAAGAYYVSALNMLRGSVGQPFAPPPVKRELQDRLVQYFHEMQATLALTLSRFAAPTDLPQLEAIYQQQLQTLEPLKQRKLELLRNMHQSSDRFEDLRKSADTISDLDERDQAMLTLVQGAMGQNPSDERLAKLAELIEKIQSKEIHDKAWTLLKRFEVTRLTRAGNFDDAYSLAMRLTDAAIRAQALRDLALAVARRGSQTLTSEGVLSLAIEALDKADVSIEKSRLMFRITGDLVNLKNYERAFEALQYSTASMGSLKRDDFDQTTKAPVPNSLFDYRNTFGRLGSVDFDRAMFLAQGIKWREFRLAAEIATCQSVLGKKG
jgi:tetratricopeptide (TPR) repeat protein